MDRDQLTGVLMGLSRFAAAHPDIAEVDLNPLIVQPDGRLAAVDALVTRRRSTAPAPTSTPVPAEALKSIFYPRAMAFVGASAPWDPRPRPA